METSADAPRWHPSTASAGSISEEGHVFTKFHAGPQKKLRGATLSSLCILFETRLRSGGVHRYRYSILAGSVGPADGVGFVFDTKVRRMNIQRMRSVFLNKHGQVCMRNFEHIEKLPHYLPRLEQGVHVLLTVDLDQAMVRFQMDGQGGCCLGAIDLSLEPLLLDSLTGAAPGATQPACPASGFFCAIVTDNIRVSLH